MKKYASDFVKQIEDQKKNYSKQDYLDMLDELEASISEMTIELRDQIQLEMEE
jgi:hypothetical protein